MGCAAIHLVVMREPYLGRVLAGTKTIESRFLRVRAAPYGVVAPGERLLLKRAGGPVVAEATAAAVRQYADLTPDQIDALLKEHASGLRLDDDFAARARGCRYAVLIWLADVRRLAAPLRVEKRDRRAWVRLDDIGAP